MVRDHLNLTADDVGDKMVVEKIEDAVATIELETGLSLDCRDCSEAEVVAIKDLAAIYLFCHLSGGSAAGLNFSVRDLRVDALGGSPSIDMLYREFERLVQKLRRPNVRRV